MEGLGQVTASQVPADVREAGKDARRRYDAAVQFEQMLMQRMLTQMAPASAGGEATGDDDPGKPSDATSNHFAKMMPELMAQAVSSGGGLGLARELYEAMGGADGNPVTAGKADKPVAGTGADAGGVGPE